jgi:hypothetical protein
MKSVLDHITLPVLRVDDGRTLVARITPQQHETERKPTKPNRSERRVAKVQSRKRMTITAIHEAGHAVGRYLTADMMGHNVEGAISWIEVHLENKPLYESGDGRAILSASATTFGPMYSRQMIDVLACSPCIENNPYSYAALEADVARCVAAGIDVVRWAKAKAIICMCGPVAEAIYTHGEIATVVNSYECEGDVIDAVRDCMLAGKSTEEALAYIEIAIDIAADRLADPRIWRAVLRLADSLPAQGRLEGKVAADIIGRALR